jgi:hypothetical protein
MRSTWSAELNVDIREADNDCRDPLPEYLAKVSVSLPSPERRSRSLEEEGHKEASGARVALLSSPGDAEERVSTEGGGNEGDSGARERVSSTEGGGNEGDSGAREQVSTEEGNEQDPGLQMVHQTMSSTPGNVEERVMTEEEENEGDLGGRGVGHTPLIPVYT